jgi:phosphatidylglycerol---prolipoprotein diacylglyceryl transferase
MYADFHELLKHFFGLDFPRLSLIKCFGFMVAMAFLAAGYVIFKELKRKEEDGIIGFKIDEIAIQYTTPPIDYVWNILFGFVAGYKLVGMLIDFQTASPDPMSFIFSSQGNLIAGIIIALGSVALKFYGDKKTQAKFATLSNKQKPTTKKVKTFPSTRVGDIAMIAAFGGFAGAKLFNAFETWEDFLAHPLDNLLSSSGLTFYGGLIVATIALWIFSRKIHLDFRHLCDAAAPALILGYAIGRLGCQVSGDGDWGIYNSAYMTNTDGKLVKSELPFDQMVKLSEAHVYRHFDKNEKIPHKSIQAFAGLPTWLFAYNYPNNVNNVGIPLAHCEGIYCSVLPIAVFPTPVYEFVMGIIIFIFLWKIRKRFKTPLSIFSIYLIFNGIERFLIEQIRVNYQYDWGFLRPTQAEIIAVCIALCGTFMFLTRKKIDALVTKTHFDKR